MSKPLSSRFPWLPSAFTWVVYALGVAWRWAYVLHWHDPRKYVYSDMAMYMELAKRLARPSYVVTVGDISHPPGSAWIIAFFLQRDASLQQLVLFNFVVCALVPLSVGALGWVSFGKRSGQAAVVVSSLYFAFIEFGGYFLAEIHLALLAPLVVALYLLAMKVAAEPPSRRRTAAAIGLAVLSGFLFSCAMVLKMVAMLAILGFCLLHFLFVRGAKMQKKALLLGIFLLAAAPVTAKIVHRCTVANGGHFCSGSNKSAADFLLGHYDRIQGIEWRDPVKPGVVGFGSPAAFQHGYTAKKVVPFLITNQAKNSEYAWKWIRENPWIALVLSFEHVWDCFGGSYPWPGNATGGWPGTYASHYGFLGLIFLPSVILLVDVLRQRGLIGFLGSMELVVISPLVGVCAAVFLATGEVRYRIPWDSFFIVIAIEFYRRMNLRFSEATPDAAELPGAPIPSATPAESPAAATPAAAEIPIDPIPSPPTADIAM